MFLLLCLIFVSNVFADNMTDATFQLKTYENRYNEARAVYLKALHDVKEATGPFQAARDAYVSATSTYTHSLYPDLDYYSSYKHSHTDGDIDEEMYAPERLNNRRLASNGILEKLVVYEQKYWKEHPSRRTEAAKLFFETVNRVSELRKAKYDRIPIKINP